MHPKLSIIVPVFNVENYLRKCVESLIKQDYSDYEIILVDDGSTDNSGAICDEYTNINVKLQITNNKCPIRVIHQDNAGLSAARNTGIAAAKGEYICFVDSDDYLEPNVLGSLMSQIDREQLDVLRYDYQNVRIVKESFEQERDKNSEERIVNSDERYEVFEPNKQPHRADICTDIVSGVQYLNEQMGYACYAWQWVIRRELVDTFTPGIHFEDVEWLPRMMLAAKRVNTSRTTVYNYFWREGSITLTQGVKEKIKKNTEDLMLVIEQYKTYLEQHPECKWLKNMQSSLVSGVLTTIARELYPERKEYIRRLKSMRVFPLSIADQGKTYRRRAMLTNALGPQAYCALVKIKELVS